MDHPRPTLTDRCHWVVSHRKNCIEAVRERDDIQAIKITQKITRETPKNFENQKFYLIKVKNLTMYQNDLFMIKKCY